MTRSRNRRATSATIRSGNIQVGDGASLDSRGVAFVHTSTPFDASGFIIKGTRVAGKVQLYQLLKDWLDISSASTIGDVADYGGAACILIALDGGIQARLNSDTKRVAVKDYVDSATNRGPDAPWLVTTNRRGRSNKLVYQRDGSPKPGWYCYSERPLSPHTTV